METNEKQEVGMVKKLYRVEAGGSGSFIYFSEHVVARESKCFYYIKDCFDLSDNLKRVLKGNGKRFAHETKEMALHSFKRRKYRQIKILTAQLDKARLSLNVADNYKL